METNLKTLFEFNNNLAKAYHDYTTNSGASNSSGSKELMRLEIEIVRLTNLISLIEIVKEKQVIK